MEVRELNHEIWKICETCRQEYDARLDIHVCEKIENNGRQ